MNIVKSFKVISTLSAYRIVTHSTSAAMTVKYPGSAQRPYVGVTYDTVLDTTGAIPVVVCGFAKLYFNDSCTTGNMVSSDTSGRGIPRAFGVTTTSTSLTSAYIGILVGPTVDATGSISTVLVMPGFER